MIQENKTARHYSIKEILSNNAIPNQDKLRIELKKHGYKVTQATLSRDLKELGVSRASSSGGIKYVPAQNNAVKNLRPLIGEEVISIKSNESLIVVITLPGCANFVGEFIDVQNNTDILGTLAGDNTLLIIPSSNKKISSLMTYLKQLLVKGKN